MISDDDDVNGIDGKSTVNFGLQIKNLKTNCNFEINIWANFIYFDVFAVVAGEGGGWRCVGSLSIVSQGHTWHVSRVVSSCFVGSLFIVGK